MNEMLERVAKALKFVEEGPCDPETVARAAIEAMREPSAEMLHSVRFHEERTHGPDDSYRAMIDAALGKVDARRPCPHPSG